MSRVTWILPPSARAARIRASCPPSTCRGEARGTAPAWTRVSTLWPARGVCHLVEAAEEVPDLHPPLAVRVEVESEPGALPLQELLPLLAGAGTVTSPVRRGLRD